MCPYPEVFPPTFDKDNSYVSESGISAAAKQTNCNVSDPLWDGQDCSKIEDAVHKILCRKALEPSSEITEVCICIIKALKSCTFT